MHSSDIVRMANQIADFFKSYGPDEATREVATHINNYWEPRMRQHFFETLSANANEFNPLVVAAAALVRKPHQKKADVPEPMDQKTGLPMEAKEA